jgi:nucleotide-binding universal stress UspA family protein
MILPTNSEPANRRSAFGMVPNGIRSSRMEPTVAAPKSRERWLVVVGSEDAESQCLSLVRRFTKDDAEIHFATPSGADFANEVRRLAIALEVDWLCMVAERGRGSMSLFLRSDVERILRAAPCPVICIPESPLRIGELRAANKQANPIRRVLAPIRFGFPIRSKVENAVEVAERFGARLDLLGIDELLRIPDRVRPVRPRLAKRQQSQAAKNELSNLADELVPKRMRGRVMVSVGLPLFYATIQWARKLKSHSVVLTAPTRLWAIEGRIDVGVERILHGAECPVICIPGQAEFSTSPQEVPAHAGQCHQRRDWPAPLRFTSRDGCSPVPRCKNLGGARPECAASTINRKRLDAYETENIGN